MKRGTLLTILLLLLVLGGGSLFLYLNRDHNNLTTSRETPENFVLRIPLRADPTTLDPARGVDIVSTVVISQLYNGLLSFDEKQHLRPDLAERWEISKDQKRITFYLRKGVKFHNGRELTAADVEYTFTRVLNPKTRSPRAFFLFPIEGAREFFKNPEKVNRVKGIVVKDSYTLELHLAEVYGPFISQLSLANFGILAKEEVKKFGEEYGAHPMGSGPFKLERWERGRYLRLVRNEDYFLGLAGIAGIEYRIIPDDITSFEAYHNGELDMTNIPVGYMERVENDEGLRKEHQRKELIAAMYLVMNLSVKPFKEELFKKNYLTRQSLNYTVDRGYMCEQILENRYRPFVGVIPKGMMGYNQNNDLAPRYTYSIEDAKTLFAERNRGDEQGFYNPEFTLYYYPQGDGPIIAQKAQKYFQDASFKTEIRSLEYSTFLDSVDGGKLEMFKESWVSEYPDPDYVMYTFFYSENMGYLGNHAFYKNQEVDRLVLQARKEFNPLKRQTLYRRAEEIILEDAPFVFLFSPVSHILVKPYVRDIELSALGVDPSLAFMPLANFHDVKIDPLLLQKSNRKM